MCILVNIGNNGFCRLKSLDTACLNRPIKLIKSTLSLRVCVINFPQPPHPTRIFLYDLFIPKILRKKDPLLAFSLIDKQQHKGSGIDKLKKNQYIIKSFQVLVIFNISKKGELNKKPLIIYSGNFFIKKTSEFISPS